LLAACALTLLLQVAVLYLPAGQALLHTMPLNGPELALCVTVSAMVFIAVEIGKWSSRRISRAKET